MFPNPADDPVLKQGAKIVGDLALEVLKWSGSKIKETYLVHAAAARYLGKYLERHGYIKVLGMPEPVRLRDVYTSVQLLPPEQAQRFASINELNPVDRVPRPTPTQPSDYVDAITLANSCQFLNILGQPGSGKSTLLREIGLESLLPVKPILVRDVTALSSDLGRAYHHRCLPVFIELKTLADEHLNLTDIVKTEFETCGFASEFANSALKSGKLLILLDGLDEVPEGRLEATIRAIRDFVDANSANRFITSCRTAFYRHWFTRFRDVTLAEFNIDQIKAFVSRWFGSTSGAHRGMGEALSKLLLSPARLATLELAKTPLLLTLICLVYQRTQGLPPSRSYLYKRALDVLLDEWAAQNVVHRPIYQGLYPDLEIQMLAEIAGKAFAQNRLFFSASELSEQIRTFLSTELNAPKNLDAQAVLRSIEIQQGLLVQRAQSTYSFSHVTIQEYLTARYYLDYTKIPEMIENHLLDIRWREVFLLLAGMTQAQDLLTRMTEQVRREIRNNGFNDFMKWADCSTKQDHNPDAALASRAIALELAVVLSHVELSNAGLCEVVRLLKSHSTTDGWIDAIVLVTALWERSYQDATQWEKLPSAIAKMCERFSDVFRATLVEELRTSMMNALSASSSWKIIRNGVKQSSVTLHHSICSSLKIPSTRNSGHRGIEALSDAFMATSLIVECKESALSLTAAQWDNISARLLSDN